MFKIDKRLLLYLAIAFFCATIIGTISHEGGHYLAARLMGFQVRINYMSTWLTGAHQLIMFNQFFWFTAGGPLLTMLTGTIGFLFLITSRIHKERLTIKQWVLVFLSLFWLRQSANFVVGCIGYLITGETSGRDDESSLNFMFNWRLMLKWPSWSILIVTAFIGFCVLAYILFKVIPKPQRFTFILAGFIGGVSGYLFWLVYFGKYIMP